MLGLLFLPVLAAGLLAWGFSDGGTEPSGSDTDPDPQSACDVQDAATWIEENGPVSVPAGLAFVPGSASADDLRGTSKGDFIFGDSGADTLRGLGGNDVIDHFYGPNAHNGNHEQDDWYDDHAVDVIDAGAGNDTIDIGMGDQLTTGTGADHVDLFVDREVQGTEVGTALANWAPATLTDFTAGTDHLNVTVEVGQGMDNPPLAELHTATDGSTEVWLTGTGSAIPTFPPMIVARVDAGATIDLADITVTTFYNEVS